MVLEISSFVSFELIMGPKGIVEGVVAVLAMFRVVGVKEPGKVAIHLYAQFAVEVDLPLVEGPHPHPYLNTHK